jgi:hypothetical protein
MADIGTIFSAPMVRALLREAAAPGTGKRQTRRLAWKRCRRADRGAVEREDGWFQPTRWQAVLPGDQMWVRESATLDASGAWIYAADPIFDGEYKGQYRWGWRNARGMPRAASRLLLTITDVRRQRLQEISDNDAISEGLERALPDRPEQWHVRGVDVMPESFPTDAFAALWDHLHNDWDWASNPEVVALTFTVCTTTPTNQERAP